MSNYEDKLLQTEQIMRSLNDIRKTLENDISDKIIDINTDCIDSIIHNLNKQVTKTKTKTIIKNDINKTDNAYDLSENMIKTNTNNINEKAITIISEDISTKIMPLDLTITEKK